MRFILSIILFACFCSLSAQDAIPFMQGQLAFDGNDLIEYFSDKVVPGSEQFQTYHEGVNLYFSSEENLKKFKANPGRYFPAYGGWCAIAMVDGLFILPNYELYKIQDGRLLFFQVRAFFNGLTHWNKDPMKNLVSADMKYQDFFEE